MPRYVVIVEPGDHNYSAYVPDVPGVIATGATVGEVTDMMREALEFHLEGLPASRCPSRLSSRPQWM